MSGSRSKIIAAMEERGDKPPPHLTRGVRIEGTALFYWNAFRELRTCVNPAGMIPWTAIRDFAATYRIQFFDEFLSIIRRMEVALREIQGRETEKPRQ